MPLPKRAIVPVNVSNVTVPKEVDNELEYVANATLSNLTRQLASLSYQASDIFTELTEQLIGITNRSERLNQRIESLKFTISQTAIREDDLMIGLMSLQANPYRSRMEADQQVLNTNSMPNSIVSIYQQCEPPPALDQLDKFRYDNKQSMKFYTDPTFFFHLWCQEMLQETKQKKKKKVIDFFIERLFIIIIVFIINVIHRENGRKSKTPC